MRACSHVKVSGATARGSLRADVAHARIGDASRNVRRRFSTRRYLLNIIELIFLNFLQFFCMSANCQSVILF